MMRMHFYRRSRQTLALTLSYLLILSTANAGIVMTGADGIVMTGADGIVLTGADGIVMTGADGIVMTGADGIVMTGADGVGGANADGIVMTGADGVTPVGPNGIVMTGTDGIVMTGADGIVMTGADGIVMTGADGTHYTADSVTVRMPNGVNFTQADGVRVFAADGVSRPSADGIVMTGADGIVMTGADGIVMTGADGIVCTGADGRTFDVKPDGIVMTGADSIVVSRPSGIVMTGADGIVMTGADGIVMTGADGGRPRSGLQSLDPELAVKLNQLTDDSTVNVVLVFHHQPSDADLFELQRVGVTGGTRFRVLPMVMTSATRDQLIAVSRLPSVRSIYYAGRTVQFDADPGRGLTGVERVRADADLTRAAGAGLPVSGRGVTVAVLDTGVDGTHADLAGRVVQNVKLADTQGAGVGFNHPVNAEGLPNTDQLYGHGTFVAGVIAGSGSRSDGAYTGVAPGARVVGLSAGDANLFYVLDGLDYLLDKGASLGVRVVNCSFSANTVFDFNDPVNIATRMLTERGVNVVFSAGNTGPGLRTLNPYAVAPWVVSVGAWEPDKGRLASFSARGEFASGLFRPTVVAPGVRVVSLRSGGVSLTGVEGVGFNNDAGLQPAQLPHYTTASGTSFSAPQVAGAIALMLEANPRLTPAQVRDILQRTATPLPPYLPHEVGAGMLNAHAAVLEAAFPQRRMGTFRATLDRGQVRFVSDAAQEFSGTVQPGALPFETTLSVPEGALFASVQIGWGPLWSASDLGLQLFDAGGAKRADVNALNLPGLTGKRERAAVDLPPAGALTVKVRHTLGALAPAAQGLTGVFETGRAEYAEMRDLAALGAQQRDEVLRSIRAFTMWPVGRNFRPGFAVTRADLAAAMVLGARVPQYLPAQHTYRDVRDQQTRLFVESVQRAPGGALFTDAQAGGAFSPEAAVDRLTAAVVLVRAAGLQAEAESQNNRITELLDIGQVPSALRGYVQVALRRDLMSASGLNFRPSAPLTRAELAHALVVMQRLQGAQ